ncbi:hypothetical protein HP453_16865 [Glutamicibacter halophytocola]|nr:hypothetical protein [Glutamicibacter halophytocola]
MHWPCDQNIRLLAHRVALSKIRPERSAEVLEDLRAPPSHRLDARGGDRAGQYSITTDGQCRIRFVRSAA